MLILFDFFKSFDIVYRLLLLAMLLCYELYNSAVEFLKLFFLLNRYQLVLLLTSSSGFLQGSISVPALLLYLIFILGSMYIDVNSFSINSSDVEQANNNS